MRAYVDRFSLTDPGDVSALKAAFDSGAVKPERVVAVIGKTPGNGLTNDYTRGYLTQSLALLISDYTGVSRERVTATIPFIFSGGVEGVLSPHYSVFSVDDSGADRVDGEPALALATAFTAPLIAVEIGGQGQIDATRDAVRSAMASAGIERAEDVHFVQVKGPCLTASAISEARRAGAGPVADTPEHSMALSRIASAFGVGLALGEIDATRFHYDSARLDPNCFSSVASCSAGVEVQANEIVVLGNSRRWHGPLRIGHRPMADALDLAAVVGVFEDLGLAPGPQLSDAQSRRLRSVLVKCEPDRTGRIRGEPHTMLNDGDMNAQRHIRAAVGALVAGVCGDTRLFVSGGAEHQGPDGGGLIAAIASVDGEP